MSDAHDGDPRASDLSGDAQASGASGDAPTPGPGREAIRPAAASDLPAIAAIYDHYVDTSTVTFDEEHRPLDAWRAALARLDGLGLPFLVLTDRVEGGEVLGFAYASPWREKRAYRFTAESTIYLAPGAAGRGLGTRLLDSLVTAATDAGLRQLIAVVSDTGAEASRRLHERAGFAQAGHLPDTGFKFGRWMGVLHLQRSLG